QHPPLLSATPSPPLPPPLSPYTTLFRSLHDPVLGQLDDRRHDLILGPETDARVAGRGVVARHLPCRGGGRAQGARPPPRHGRCRSEEHTSELQSHLNLVCPLLLEKKKSH